jgi:hypothetical protein
MKDADILNTAAHDVPHLMARSRAAKLLDDIRQALARRDSAETIENFIQRQYGIDPLLPCRGEAHSNAYIDNCMCCAPRWGHVGKGIKIR